MAIKKIGKVSCSLNLGLIYQLNYSYVPQEGVKISIYFVSESGKYNTKNIRSTTVKQQIKIGTALFNLFPVTSKVESSPDRKVIRVDFEDETFQLNNYYIALTGRGCGIDVSTLGQTVDTRTPSQKEKEDPDLFKIKEFTTFEDVEYSFENFITILKKKFPVEVLSGYDKTLTRDFTGTFKSVLDSWCSYFNLTYFFENSILKIVSPSDLNISFPDIPENALEYNEEETLKNTFNKTVWNYFKQEGGEYVLDNDDPSMIAIMPVRPYENIFDIKQLSGQVQVDMNQVVAAQYGQEFWFLYNFQKGTADSICGWRNIVNTEFSLPNTFKGVFAIGQTPYQAAMGSNAEVAILNRTIFDRNYEFYLEYGDKIAGRVYISNGLGDLEIYDDYQFYDQGNGSIFDPDVLRTRPQVSLSKFRPPINKTLGPIPESLINESFPGVICNGNRLYFIDDAPKDLSSLFLSEELRAKVSSYHDKLINGVLGNGAIDYGNNNFLIAYIRPTLDTEILNLIDLVEGKIPLFAYRQQVFNLKGLAPIKKFNEDFNPLNDTKITILSDTNGVSSNISTIKAVVDSDLLVYYAKYQDCKHSSSNERNLYSRKFEPREISNDIPVSIKPSKKSQGVIEITRDFTYFEQYSKSEILNKLSQPFTINQKTLEFSLNYFYDDIPSSFISNGLVGLDLSVAGDSISALYRYSNEMLNVPVSEADLFKLDQKIRDSWINTYKPKNTITT